MMSTRISPRDVPERMKEFENLVQRTHRSGLKVIIDFVPNHVARQYHSDAQPDGTSQLGQTMIPIMRSAHIITSIISRIGTAWPI